MQAQTSVSPIVYESFQDRDNPSDWRVEAIDSKAGDVYIAIFAGPLAQERAAEYAKFKNGELSQKATSRSI
jgi:hypothetical protein